jgi:hypothetical protein
VAASWPRDLMIDLLFIDADHSYKESRTTGRIGIVS